jgi:glucose-6-phosphate-specific signal transduction histidine kinase
MELNVCKRGEPSHIHIRRPSRDQALPVESSAIAFPVAEGVEQPLPGFGLDGLSGQAAD